MLLEPVEHSSLCSKCSMNDRTALPLGLWMQFSCLFGGGYDLRINLNSSMGPQSIQVHNKCHSTRKDASVSNALWNPKCLFLYMKTSFL